MSIARTSGVFIGTDETTGVTIANNATTTSSEVDMAGNDTSEVWFHLFAKLTSTVTAGTLDVSAIYARVTGQEYTALVPVIGSFAPTNGTQAIYVDQCQASRYMEASAKNNATGANATNVTIGYEKYARS